MTEYLSTWIYLFIFYCPGSSLLHVSFSSCGQQELLFFAEHGLEGGRLRSCSVQAQLHHGMWTLPGPEI